MVAPHGLDAMHGAQVTRMTLHQGGWNQGLANQMLLAIHVVHDALEQSCALDHALFNLLPTVGRDDEGKQIHRPRALRTVGIGIDVVGDAVVAHLARQDLVASVQIFGAAGAQMLKKALPHGFKRKGLVVLRKAALEFIKVATAGGMDPILHHVHQTGFLA